MKANAVRKANTSTLLQTTGSVPPPNIEPIDVVQNVFSVPIIGTLEQVSAAYRSFYGGAGTIGGVPNMPASQAAEAGPARPRPAAKAKKRIISNETRMKLRVAQEKRWAAVRKGKAGKTATAGG